MSSLFGKWRSIMKVSLVYAIDAFRHVAALVINPRLKLKGSRHRLKKRRPDLAARG